MKLGLLGLVLLVGLVAATSTYPTVRVSPGRDETTVTVNIEPRPEHRAVEIVGAVVDEEGLLQFYRSSLEPADGRRQYRIAWKGVPSGKLDVTYQMYGVCESARASAFVR